MALAEAELNLLRAAKGRGAPALRAIMFRAAQWPPPAGNGQRNRLGGGNCGPAVAAANALRQLQTYRTAIHPTTGAHSSLRRDRRGGTRAGDILARAMLLEAWMIGTGQPEEDAKKSVQAIYAQLHANSPPPRPWEHKCRLEDQTPGRVLKTPV